MHDCSRAGRAFLTLETESSSDYAFCSRVQIGIGIDYGTVFAAHFCNHALEPYLSRLVFGCHFINAQTYFF